MKVVFLIIVAHLRQKRFGYVKYVEGIDKSEKKYLGIVFGALEGKREITLGRSLVLGAATGVLFWIIVPLFFGALINHVGFDFGGFLYSFVPLLLYGVILGAFSFQRDRAVVTNIA